MDYELISSFKVEELKNLKTYGRRLELIARVFAASENNVPLVQSAVEIEYRNKLIVDEFEVSDPFTLDDGWLEEEEGNMLWPMVLSTDILILDVLSK